jgi:ubiquinone/menaquinone biosynthesis C-methylase UbiE
LTLFAMLGLLLSTILVIGLVWRHAYFCPSWLVPLLENPYVEAIAGAELLLRRAGVRAGMQVLDAGCGPGRITVPAAQAVGTSGRVVAVDIQPRMLEKLEGRLRDRGVTNVTTVLAGLGDGKLPADHFDVAFLVTVLGEVPDKAAALGDIYGCLRAGGILSITEVLPDPHYQPLRRVRELARRAGFREMQVFPGVVSYTMNLVKDTGS